MLQVINCVSFQGKKDPTKTYFKVNLIDEKGNVAPDVFVPDPIDAGTAVYAEPRIYAGKLAFDIRPLKAK